jgi:hypothetical protein
MVNVLSYFVNEQRVTAVKFQVMMLTYANPKH